jgi:hypothetical protein
LSRKITSPQRKIGVQIMHGFKNKTWKIKQFSNGNGGIKTILTGYF